MRIRNRLALLLGLVGLVGLILPGCTGEQAPAPAKPKVPASELHATFRQAALDGAIDKVRAALEQGAMVDAPVPPHTDQSTPQSFDEGATALMLASFMGHTEVVDLLLQKKANVNAADAGGRTPLMFCSTGPYERTAQRLLEAGAEVNASDELEGFTALMFAAAEGHAKVVQLLLEHGADIAAVDEDGDSALSFARQNRHQEVVNLLEKAADKG